MAVMQRTIDNSELGLVIDSKVTKNIYSNTCTPSGMDKGVVNSDYQGSAKGVSAVGVTLVSRPGLTRRVLGGNANGGLISNEGAFMMSNTTQQLDLLNRIDPIVQLPNVQEGMVSFSFAEQVAYNIGGFVQEQVDKDTLQEMYDSALVFGATIAGGAYSNCIRLEADGNAFEALKSANNHLTNLPANDYDTQTPTSGRVQVCTQTMYDKYLSTNGVVVVGSDTAFKTLVKGVEGYTEDEIVSTSAFRGVLYGINTYVAPDSFFPKATAGTVHAIVTHPIATTRAIHTDESKIVDATAFIGKLFQSAYQYGILTVRPHMIACIVSNDWANA